MKGFDTKELAAKKEFEKATGELEKIDVPDKELTGLDNIDYDAGQAFEEAVDSTTDDNILQKNAQLVKIVYAKITPGMKVADVKNLVIGESFSTVFQVDGEEAEVLSHALTRKKFGKSAYDKMVKQGQGNPNKEKPVNDISEALADPK